jgi:3-hydroxyisobutyrate dehydrogenase-like beta-hydroxyacid dehydrogenase
MMNQASVAEVIELARRIGVDPIRLVAVLKLGSGSSNALTMLPTNTTVPVGVVEHLSGVEALDMEVFDRAMTEAGVDARAVTERGLVGAHRLLEVVRNLNP